MARFNSTQTFMHGDHPVPVQRNENLIAHSLFIVLLIGAIIGGLALLLWSYQIGAATGGRSVPPVVVTPPSRTTPRPPPPPATIVVKVESVKVEAKVEVVNPTPPPPPTQSNRPGRAW